MLARHCCLARPAVANTANLLRSRRTEATARTLSSHPSIKPPRLKPFLQTRTLATGSDKGQQQKQQQPSKVYSLKGKTGESPSAKTSSSSDNEQEEMIGYYDRNFITAMRAMQDFLLRPQDIKDLRMTTRRSPNERDPPINVYWRKDVEAVATALWGSREKLEVERERRQEARRVKRRIQEGGIKGMMGRILEKQRKSGTPEVSSSLINNNCSGLLIRDLLPG